MTTKLEELKAAWDAAYAADDDAVYAAYAAYYDYMAELKKTKENTQ